MALQRMLLVEAGGNTAPGTLLVMRSCPFYHGLRPTILDTVWSDPAGLVQKPLKGKPDFLSSW
jgi:hypothetical protein